MKAGQIWGEGRREWQGNPLSANFSKWVVYLEVVFLQNFLILKLFSRSLLAPSKIYFLVLRKSLLHGINRCSIWIYALKMRKGMTRLCISREMRTIKMWRCCYWRWKVQKCDTEEKHTWWPNQWTHVCPCAGNSVCVIFRSLLQSSFCSSCCLHLLYVFEFFLSQKQSACIWGKRETQQTDLYSQGCSWVLLVLLSNCAVLFS